MALSSLTTVYTVYTGTYYLQPPNVLLGGVTVTGFITFPDRQPMVTFTVVSSVSAAGVSQPVLVNVTVPASTVNYPNPTANITLWTPASPTRVNGVTAYEPGIPQIAILTSVSMTPTAAIVKSDSGTVSTTAASSSTSQMVQSSGATQSPISIKPAKVGYSTSAVAGAAVGCLFGGILLSALFCFLWMRRRTAGKKASQATEKGLPLLQGHGEVLYAAGGNHQAWEKHLPQADSDSTIKVLTSRTLDQVAMHVENFYTSQRSPKLTAEQQLEIEAFESSKLSQPISTMLSRSQRTEDLIKHYISSYILAMIAVDGSNANGVFLPKSYRRQWQYHSQSAPAVVQAYSRWRVLTAYLRENGSDERSYWAERDAEIDVAARRVCKAFEPWAKAERSTRLQNMVGIMKRASELGMQLFSQPAVFEWQWQPTMSGRLDAALGAQTQIAILPGLYKVTDQSAQPLTTPLRLIEPQLVDLKDL